MKIGMNMLVWTAHVREQHYPLFSKLKQAGYDGVEISIGLGTLEEHQRLGKLLADEGLETTCVCAPAPENNPASPDAAVRSAAVDWLKSRIDIAHALGSTVIGGPNHSAFAYFTRQAPQDEEYQWSADVLRSVGDHAANAGLKLALEPLNRFECYLVNTVAQCRKLIDMVDHPAVAGMIDTHHANIEEKSFADPIRAMTPYLAHVHTCENDRGTPGRGLVRWDEVFGALAEVGYDGWLTIESFSRDDVDFANAINVWREFSPVEELYTEGHNFLRQKVAEYFA